MLKRTHTCGEPRATHAGNTVTLCGWVNTYRDQGKGLVFLDLRDRDGLCQVVCDLEDAPPHVVAAARSLRREDCIAVKGLLRKRAGDPNLKLATGEVELLAAEIEVFNKAIEVSLLGFAPSVHAKDFARAPPRSAIHAPVFFQPAFHGN